MYIDAIQFCSARARPKWNWIWIQAVWCRHKFLALKSVSFMAQLRPRSQGLCDGQAVVRLDFSGPYKKAKIELIYGGEPRLWTATLSDTEMSYGFGSNHGFSSSCASVQVYNRQFRVYSNKLPGYMYNTIDGNTLMVVIDDAVDKGANMSIDISDESLVSRSNFVNSSKNWWDEIRNNPYLFTLSGQPSIYGPPTDSYVYAGFNRVPYGSFHNGSGLCRVRITFKREGKGRKKGTAILFFNYTPQLSRKFNMACCYYVYCTRINRELLLSGFTFY